MAWADALAFRGVFGVCVVSVFGFTMLFLDSAIFGLFFILPLFRKRRIVWIFHVARDYLNLGYGRRIEDLLWIQDAARSPGVSRKWMSKWVWGINGLEVPCRRITGYPGRDDNGLYGIASVTMYYESTHWFLLPTTVLLEPKQDSRPDNIIVRRRPKPCTISY